MKKQYISPLMEVEILEAMSVIATSGAEAEFATTAFGQTTNENSVAAHFEASWSNPTT